MANYRGYQAAFWGTTVECASKRDSSESKWRYERQVVKLFDFRNELIIIVSLVCKDFPNQTPSKLGKN